MHTICINKPHLYPHLQPFKNYSKRQPFHNGNDHITCVTPHFFSTLTLESDPFSTLTLDFSTLCLRKNTSKPLFYFTVMVERTFNALRSAAGRFQLVFLTASVRPLIELTYSGRSRNILSSPFFNIFAQQFLGLLPEEEARQLIREPARRAGVAFSPVTEDFLYNLAGGHPLALQVACFHACEVAAEADPTEIEHRTKRELEAHFQYYWQNLTPAERDALDHISEVASYASNESTLRGILRNLVQKCLLIAEGGGTYRYPSRLWADFVAT
jgi:hypothetical protein